MSRLTILGIKGTASVDLSPVGRLPSLRHLEIKASEGITDIGKLADLKLKSLVLYKTRVSDISAVRGMPLEVLELFASPVRDISSLRGARLRRLDLHGTNVTDLSALKGMPLEHLFLEPGLIPTNAGMLREIKTLKQINGRPAEEVLKVATGGAVRPPAPGGTR